MRKSCPKCGVESDIEDSPTAACPSCGAIFAKVEQLSTAQRQAIRAAATARGAPQVHRNDDAPRPRLPIIERVLWALTAIGAMLGILQMVMTSSTAESAPQQAAGFAMAIAYAVIPYVLARAAQELRS